MDAAVHQPSKRYALTTFIVLLGVPIATFALATVWMVKGGITQPDWGVLAAVYAFGTLPGLVIGVRYPASTVSRVAFGLGYLVVCCGLYFVVSLSIGCWLTNVCP